MAIFIWGSCYRDHAGDSGKFPCPNCTTTTDYAIIQTHQYFHVYFIPLYHERLAFETVCCQRCGNRFPITVLSASAPQVVSPLDVAQLPDASERTPLANIVRLTSAAAEEIRRRHGAGRFPADAVIRVSVRASHESGYDLKFDYAECDGGDWIGQSEGIPIVVDQRDAPLLVGKMITYRDGRFCDAT